MHEVEVSYTAQIPYREFLESLSPASIIESTEIYHIISVEDLDNGTEVVVLFEGLRCTSADNEMTLEFSKLDNGYEYTMVDGSGLFEERYSKISVTRNGETRISAEARYTINKKWSFIVDRLAAGTVKKELETVLLNLIDDIQSESDGR